MSQNPFVVIKTCNDLVEAQIMRGLLEQNDIPAIIEDENFNSVYPVFTAANGVRIKVHEGHVGDAVAVLAGMDNVEPITRIKETDGDECASCGSSEIFRYRSFFTWFLTPGKPDVDGQYCRCAICDHRWRDGNKKTNKLFVVLGLGGVVYCLVWLLLWVIEWLRYL